MVTDGLRKITITKKTGVNYLKQGDLLFNWRNGSKHLVGKTAMFNWENDKFVFASFLLGIRPKKDFFTSSFLWLLLNQYRREDVYLGYMRQVVNGLFNREELKILKVPLVPLPEQEEIVARIEKEQALVNANRELMAIFEGKIKAEIAKVWGEVIKS